MQQLSKEPQHAPLRRLLDVMLNGDLPGFKAAATPAVLQVGFKDLGFRAGSHGSRDWETCADLRQQCCK